MEFFCKTCKKTFKTNIVLPPMAHGHAQCPTCDGHNTSPVRTSIEKAPDIFKCLGDR